MSDDLIKRSDAIEMLQEAIMAYPPVMKGCGETRDSTLEEAINLILDIPSADRPQGEWIEHEHGFWTFVNDKGERDGWIPDYECNLCGARAWKVKTKFCPNCGARMKGADDEV